LKDKDKYIGRTSCLIFNRK